MTDRGWPILLALTWLGAASAWAGPQEAPARLPALRAALDAPRSTVEAPAAPMATGTAEFHGDGAPSPASVYRSAAESIRIIAGDEIFSERAVGLLRQAKERGVKDIRVLLAERDSPVSGLRRVSPLEQRTGGIAALLALGADVRLVPFYASSVAIIDGRRVIEESFNYLALSAGDPDGIRVVVDDSHPYLHEHIRRFDLMHRAALRPNDVPMLPPPAPR